MEIRKHKYFFRLRQRGISDLSLLILSNFFWPFVSSRFVFFIYVSTRYLVWMLTGVYIVDPPHHPQKTHCGQAWHNFEFVRYTFHSLQKEKKVVDQTLCHDLQFWITQSPFFNFFPLISNTLTVFFCLFFYYFWYIFFSPWMFFLWFISLFFSRVLAKETKTPTEERVWKIDWSC